MREECGIFGISGIQSAAALSRLGIFSLQHRGEESCGIASSDGSQIYRTVGMGLVAEVFGGKDLNASLPGCSAIGHTRYSTAGTSELVNAQPFYAHCALGQFALAHNGNLTNSRELRKRLENQGAAFTTSSDTETILHLVPRMLQPDMFSAIAQALGLVEGAFSLVFLTNDSVIAARDPFGFRPIAIAKSQDGAWAFASETCAFDHLRGFEYVGEVAAGEIVEARTGQDLRRKQFAPVTRKANCIFEHVYFSRPNSIVFGREVRISRAESGRLLVEGEDVDADIVVPVLDSGKYAAAGYAKAMGIPLAFGLDRGHYSGRSFIQPTQESREDEVRMKHSVVASVVKGKRIVLVDDSLVRSTTARVIIAMLREAGAKEVHLRLACPPIRHPCFFGVDIPNQDKLIAVGRNESDIAEIVEADSIRFLSLGSLHTAVGNSEGEYCDACMTGNYPKH